MADSQADSQEREQQAFAELPPRPCKRYILAMGRWAAKHRDTLEQAIKPPTINSGKITIYGMERLPLPGATPETIPSIPAPPELPFKLLRHGIHVQNEYLDGRKVDVDKDGNELPMGKELPAVRPEPRKCRECRLPHWKCACELGPLK